MNLRTSIRALKVSGSVTSNIRTKALKLQNSSSDAIFDLGSGQFKLSTPEHLSESLVKSALIENTNLYTEARGIKELRSLLAQNINYLGNTNYSADNIVVTSGAKPALFQVLLSIINPGDEVILLPPYWGTYKSQVQVLGGKVIEVDPYSSQSKQTSIKLAVSQRTKAVIFNIPSNPTGEVIDQNHLKKILHWLDENKIFAIFDIPYKDFIFDEKYDLFDIFDNKLNNLIIIDSCSKSLAIPGWRIGYVAASSFICKVVSNLQSNIQSNSSSIVQYTLLDAFHKHDQNLEYKLKLKCILQNNLSYAKMRLSDFQTNTKLPAGGYYIFICIDHEDYISQDSGSSYSSVEHLCEDLLETEGVVVVPGTAFGVDKGFRVSMCVNEEIFKVGFDRLCRFLLKNRNQKNGNLNGDKNDY